MRERAKDERAAAITRAIDAKTKPVGSLGRIEDLAAQIATVQGTIEPEAESCRLTIFAADHGIAAAGVSAYPQAVTRQMVQNFLGGGAAATVFARTLGVEVSVVDAGVAGEALDHPSLVSKRIDSGTANALEGPAMTEGQYEQALQAGLDLGAAISEPVACFGEMGIGNTSSASLMAAKILALPVRNLVGPGTGLEGEGLARKAELLDRAAQRTDNHLLPSDAAMEYGGFEIIMMAGAMIGAVCNGRVVVVDGFISSVAALLAARLDEGVQPAFVFAHRSAEPGHEAVLEALDADPLLDFGMRLGEGTGALLAWPIIRSAAAMLREMATFDSAAVSGPS